MAGRQIQGVGGRKHRLLTQHDIANLMASEDSSGVSDYNDLTNKPTLFSGVYADLTGKPALGTAAAEDVSAFLPAGTTTSDVPEGTNLYYTNARVDARLSPGYIDGLQMQWVSGTSVTVSSGTAYIPSLGAYLQSSSPIALTGLTLTASTWYHLYLYSNAGTPAVEASTTAPATAYFGTARSKTGDTTRRYLGSVKTDSSSHVLSFYHEASTGSIHYRVDLNNAALFLVNNGTATSDATISAAGAVPVTARTMLAFAENNDTGGLVFISNADAGTPASTHILAFIRASRSLYGDIQLTSSQTFTYEVQTTGKLSCYCAGYRYAR